MRALLVFLTACSIQTTKPPAPSRPDFPEGVGMITVRGSPPEPVRHRVVEPPRDCTAEQERLERVNHDLELARAEHEAYMQAHCKSEIAYDTRIYSNGDRVQVNPHPILNCDEPGHPSPELKLYNSQVTAYQDLKDCKSQQTGTPPRHRL